MKGFSRSREDGRDIPTVIIDLCVYFSDTSLTHSLDEYKGIDEARLVGPRERTGVSSDHGGLWFLSGCILTFRPGPVSVGSCRDFFHIN